MVCIAIINQNWLPAESAAPLRKKERDREMDIVFVFVARFGGSQLLFTRIELSSFTECASCHPGKRNLRSQSAYQKGNSGLANVSR